MPLWLIAIRNPEIVPDWLSFVIPLEMGRLPILAQLFLAEFIIDGLRLASMNTPGMLSNSLSVIGGLILGDFSIQIGWLIPEVVLYGAFVATLAVHLYQQITLNGKIYPKMVWLYV